jgi:hypothetical protein
MSACSKRSAANDEGRLDSGGDRIRYWNLVQADCKAADEDRQKMKTYQIAPDGKSITCLICWLTSYHPEDVRQLYCGNCHRFHEPALGLRGRVTA